MTIRGRKSTGEAAEVADDLDPLAEVEVDPIASAIIASASLIRPASRAQYERLLSVITSIRRFPLARARCRFSSVNAMERDRSPSSLAEPREAVEASRDYLLSKFGDPEPGWITKAGAGA